MPQLSVLIPTYNRVKYLPEAIDSVLGQTGHDIDFEVIVVDDGSTDGTDKLIKDRYADRVVYKRIEHSGRPAVVRNQGLALAQGKFIAFQDSDDVWLPGKLATQAAIYENPEVVLSYANADYIDTDSKVRPRVRLVNGVQSISGYGFMRLISKQVTPIPTPTVIIRADAAKRAGGFNEKLIVATDTDFWIRMSKQGDFHYLDSLLAHVRRDGSNISAMPSETGDKAILEHELNRIRMFEQLSEELKLSKEEREAIDYRIAELRNLVEETAKRLGEKSPVGSVKLPAEPTALIEIDKLYQATAAGRTDKLLRLVFGWSPTLYELVKTGSKKLVSPFRRVL